MNSFRRSAGAPADAAQEQHNEAHNTRYSGRRCDDACGGVRDPARLDVGMLRVFLGAQATI